MLKKPGIPPGIFCMPKAAHTTTASTPTQLPPSLEAFLNQLIEKKGFAKDLPEQFFEDTKADLRPLLTKSINLALIAALPEDLRAEFKLLAAKRDFTEEKMQEFFDQTLENQELIVTQALMNFQNQYLGLT